MLSNSIVRKLGGLMAIALLLIAFVPCEGLFIRRTQSGAIPESGTEPAATTSTTTVTTTGTTPGMTPGTESSSPTGADKAVCHGKDLVGHLNSDGAFYLPTENSTDGKGSCSCGPLTSEGGAQLLRCADNPTNFPPATGTTSYECSTTSDCPA
ncbi:uncharacterized protein MELLADRAFT_77741 [Melampsora larici-populina 98AG31]|uniref:Secreted protein n=1 Tax=Melampsora larici-populina (strain 98AG31 / pathotype 3-4-7) TaxID=747676 RepID=F4RL38_MELLP|nr:uncharacterized protein MELLADRAFT_77741 [Melampsora larici-populina 98AG31]EGG06836.1 secreted protein [Melampsora larici-populina 98AG31]